MRGLGVWGARTGDGGQVTTYSQHSCSEGADVEGGGRVVWIAVDRGGHAGDEATGLRSEVGVHPMSLHISQT